jgi:hypothetical protein
MFLCLCGKIDTDTLVTDMSTGTNIPADTSSTAIKAAAQFLLGDAASIVTPESRAYKQKDIEKIISVLSLKSTNDGSFTPLKRLDGTTGSVSPQVITGLQAMITEERTPNGSSYNNLNVLANLVLNDGTQGADALVSLSNADLTKMVEATSASFGAADLNGLKETARQNLANYNNNTAFKQLSDFSLNDGTTPYARLIQTTQNTETTNPLTAEQKETINAEAETITKDAVRKAKEEIAKIKSLTASGTTNSSRSWFGAPGSSGKAADGNEEKLIKDTNYFDHLIGNLTVAIKALLDKPSPENLYKAELLLRQCADEFIPRATEALDKTRSITGEFEKTATNAANSLQRQFDAVDSLTKDFEELKANQTEKIASGTNPFAISAEGASTSKTLAFGAGMPSLPTGDASGMIGNAAKLGVGAWLGKGLVDWLFRSGVAGTIGQLLPFARINPWIAALTMGLPVAGVASTMLVNHGGNAVAWLGKTFGPAIGSVLGNSPPSSTT